MEPSLRKHSFVQRDKMENPEIADCILQMREGNVVEKESSFQKMVLK